MPVPPPAPIPAPVPGPIPIPVPPAPVPEVPQPGPQVAVPPVPAKPTAIQLMQQMAATFAEACRGRPTKPTCSVAMREFMRMTPPLFFGGLDPMVAESWLDATIKALNAIQVSDDATRVILATYQMRDGADYGGSLSRILGM